MSDSAEETNGALNGLPHSPPNGGLKPQGCSVAAATYADVTELAKPLVNRSTDKFGRAKSINRDRRHFAVCEASSATKHFEVI